MLQNKKKILSWDCLKFIIILFLVVLWFSFFPVWIGVFIYFSNEKSKRNIEKLNFWDILRISWLNWCVKQLLENRKWWYINEDKSWNSISEKYKTNNEDRKYESQIYLEKKKKKYLEEKRRFSWISRSKSNIEKTPSYLLDSKRNKYKNSKKKDNYSSNKVEKIKNKTENSYNWNKSIWDDYESVVDIMLKNKK